MRKAMKTTGIVLLILLLAAASYIGDNCRLIETSDSDHVIHSRHSDVYLEAVDSLLK